MASSGSDEQVSSAEIETLMSQLAKDPRSKAFIPLAEEYVKAGMHQEAATVLEEGLKVYPSFVTALVALGRVYVQLEAPAKAQPILEAAIKHSPDNVRAHKMLARIYADQRNWDAAKRSCEMVLFGFAQDEEMLALKAELGGKRATEPVVATADSPQAKTGDAPEHTTASGSERPATGAQTGMARLQELLERVRQRRAPVRRQG